MSPKKIIIATATIILLSSFLTSCKLIEKIKPAPEEEATEIVEIQELAKKAEAVKKEVNMILKSEKTDDQISVEIVLENPNQKPITSVQSWLSFDITRLRGAEIDTSESDFSFVAPYANTFDDEKGLVMIGRSNSDPVTGKTIKVAKVTFDIVKEGNTVIDVYDYQEDLSGHTSVNTILDGKPYNILNKPDVPALIIEN